MTSAKPSDPIDAVYVYHNENRLRFSLRSLARYAPWIRKVHLLAAGAPPAWLAEDGARVSLARPDTRWQIFRIPGLSRQFLYLEDHFFLGQPLAPADFLTPKGGYRVFVEPAELPPGTAAQNLLNSRFGGRSARKIPASMPRLYDKSFLEEVHRIWEAPIKRQPEEISLETLYFYYLIECPHQYGAHEQTVVDPKAHGVIGPSAGGEKGKGVASLLLSRPKFFRLETEIAGSTQAILSMCYRGKSPYEKS